jgi:hypothetical protein
MKKLLYITPHLSTGGLPQYLLKKIETFNNQFEIWCIEWSNISDHFIVQKNKIKHILGNKLITLGKDKFESLNIIGQINPDIIHIEEIPETFIDSKILDIIYRDDRNYSIVVTTHSSNTKPGSIKYTADKFILVSEWSKGVFDNIFKGSIPCEVWEYPVIKVDYDKDKVKEELGFDKEYKHILNVGLFTPGKNQKHIIELARLCVNEKIKFHFVGNQADNFKDYWEPLIDNLPENCILHGERDDVDKFYMASDLFYFPSLWELNPISIKEALSFGLPIFTKDLETYPKYKESKYITDNVSVNKNMILEHFGITIENDSICLVMAHADTNYRKKLLNECLSSINLPVVLSTNYPVSEENQLLCDYYIYNKNNPLLYKEEYSKYNVFYNYWYLDNNGNKITKPFEFEHGYAAYSLIRDGLEFIEKLGYKKVHIINYDYQISNKTLNDNSKSLDNCDIIVYQQLEENYEAGFISSKIDHILPFFTKFKSRESYYKSGEPFNILEIKLKKYIDAQNSNISKRPFDSLKEYNKVNQEGLLQFSKSKE